MRDFIILEANLLGQSHPLAQVFKAEAVLAAIEINVNQLNGRALGAHAGIQRRSVNGGQDHVDAALDHGSHVVFHDPPELIGECRDMIIVHQRVAVEPLGVDQLLLGQAGVDDLDLRRPAGLELAIHVQQADFHLMNACGRILVGLDIDPQRIPLIPVGAQAVRMQIAQQIRIQAGRGSQVVAGALLIHREAHRNMLDAAHAHPVLDGRHDLNVHIGDGFVRQRIRRLEGNDLVAEAGNHAVFRALDRLGVQKHLIQSAEQFHLKFHK